MKQHTKLLCTILATTIISLSGCSENAEKPQEDTSSVSQTNPDKKDLETLYSDFFDYELTFNDHEDKDNANAQNQHLKELRAQLQELKVREDSEEAKRYLGTYMDKIIAGHEYLINESTLPIEFLKQIQEDCLKAQKQYHKAVSKL
ncbi:hypothetical protein [Bacillus bombysepticus]|uniref:hypothetical protein n=1 Tax=Bacillus bombysepticus TaxID=658666 RepID=UPI0030191E6D